MTNARRPNSKNSSFVIRNSSLAARHYFLPADFRRELPPFLVLEPMGDFIDPRTLLELREGNAVVEQAKLVAQFIRVTRQQDAVVVGDAAGGDLVDVLDNIGRAVVAERIVELRMLPELVGPLEHIREKFAGHFGRGRGAIEINVTIAVFRPG